MLFRILTVICLVLNIQSAHALFGSAYPQNPQAHYELAMQQLEAKKFNKSIVTFGAFLEGHSSHDLAPKVKIGLADSFFGKEQYLEALKLYERSHLESPYSEEGAKTLYQMGLCNLNLITKHKGQKYIPYALAAYERFVTLYPEHKLAESASEKIKVVKKIEAEYQIEVGNYYFRHKDFCAAFNHFEKVLHLENFKTHEVVDSYIGQCQQRESCLDELASCEFDLTEVNTRIK